jgi:hypothetical protein
MTEHEKKIQRLCSSLRQFFHVFEHGLEITKIARATEDSVIANLFKAPDITISCQRSVRACSKK